jgi:putative transposase
MDKFQGKYRITSHRYWGWNYAGDGIYFITLNIQNNESVLGEIKNGIMQLSDFGKIVHDQWLNSFEIRKELFLDEFVVMPTHLHGLVVLKNIENGIDGNAETHGRASLQPNRVSNPQRLFPQQRIPTPTKFQRKPKSVSSFVAGFKSATTTQIDDFIDLNKLNIPKYNSKNKLWQPNYHDHIVRNETEYWKIKKYIINNPFNWGKDKSND